MFSVLYLLTSLKAINITSFAYCREVAVALSAKSNYPILLHEAVELEQGVRLGFRYRHRIAGMSTLPWKRVPRSDQAFQAILKVISLKLIDGNLNLVLSDGWMSGAHKHFLGERSVVPMATSSDSHGPRRRRCRNVGCQNERRSGLHSEV